MDALQRRLGYIYFKYLFNDYEKALRSIGADMFKFYNNLNSLQESLINHAEFGPRFLYLHEKFTGYAPSFYCLPSSEQFPLAKSMARLYTPTSMMMTANNESASDVDNDDKQCQQSQSIDIYAIQENASPFYYNFLEGLVESSANFLWGLQVRDVWKLNLNTFLKASSQNIIFIFIFICKIFIWRCELKRSD